VLPPRYVSGEESALVHWLDGGMAMPTWRPEKPGSLTVRGRRCVVDSAETAASVALIARRGGAWFAGGGLGSRLVTISGAVADPGVFEVALGRSLGEVVGLARPARRPVGLLLGGYGGTFVGPDALDAPYADEGLRPWGALTGAGVIVVVDDSACGIAEVARIARWMANESAGQCGPCIFGLPAIADDLENLASGRGDARTEAQLHRRLGSIVGRGACAHPDGVVRMVRSALQVFAADLAAHVEASGCANAGAGTLLALPANAGALQWR
jgi:NADH:ubiquinone oxidoreductase subunit F (NADH-binding)